MVTYLKILIVVLIKYKKKIEVFDHSDHIMVIKRASYYMLETFKTL